MYVLPASTYVVLPVWILAYFCVSRVLPWHFYWFCRLGFGVSGQNGPTTHKSRGREAPCVENVWSGESANGEGPGGLHLVHNMDMISITEKENPKTWEEEAGGRQR